MSGARNLWLLLFVAAAGLSLVFGGRGGGDAAEAPVPAADGGVETITAAEAAAAPPVHLQVLNGTPEAGLARDVGLLLGRAGCVVEEVGNAPHDHFRASLLVNRRLEPARAAALAARLGGVTVVREFDGRTAADAVLVLGADAARVAAALSGSGAR